MTVRTTPHYIASYLVTAAIAPEHNIRWSTNDTEYYSVWLSGSELYSPHASWVCCSTDRNTSCEIMYTVYIELYHIHQTSCWSSPITTLTYIWCRRRSKQVRPTSRYLQNCFFNPIKRAWSSGYDVCLTRRRSRVQSSVPVFMFSMVWAVIWLTKSVVELLPDIITTDRVACGDAAMCSSEFKAKRVVIYWMTYIVFIVFI